MMPTTAADLLHAVIKANPSAAVVPELTISDEAAQHTYVSGAEDNDPLERRIDALMIDGFQRTALEFKVSRADAARETWAKTRAWARVTHRYVYVVPAGLIEHPPLYGCGLWWVDERGRIAVHRKAVVNHYPEPLPQVVIRRIAYRATPKLAEVTP